MSQHTKRTNTYYRLRTIVPFSFFLLVLLCACCSMPEAGSQAKSADPCAGQAGANGATAQDVQIAKSVFDDVNHDREANGLSPLTWCPALAQSAHTHNLTMSNSGTLSHQLAGEAELGARETQQGIVWTVAAENIGEESNVTTVQQAMDGSLLMNQLMYSEKPPDDGHRRNILDRDLTVLGVDIIVDQHNVLWLTEDFAKI